MKIPFLNTLNFTFPRTMNNTVWCIITIILILFLLSCMSNRCEMFVTESFDDGSREFSPKPWYSLNMNSNCLPGEHDTGEYCVKEGCPAGMERGSGVVGADFCYPKCAPGYESDGGGRCYKICPDGFLTRGNKCIKPTHTFNKDIIPCNKCVNTMVKITSGNKNTNKKCDNRYNPENDVTEINIKYPSYTGGVLPIVFEAFEESYGSPDGNTASHIDIEPVQTNDVKLLQEMTIQNEMTRKWKVGDHDYKGTLPCPLGYTLSGDVCKENCPPTYRDTGDKCVLDRYTVNRPSYDRGSGVPFSIKRSKYQNINPIKQCNS